MKNINIYVSEKLHINKNTVVKNDKFLIIYQSDSTNLNYKIFGDYDKAISFRDSLEGKRRAFYLDGYVGSDEKKLKEWYNIISNIDSSLSDKEINAFREKNKITNLIDYKN